MPFTGRRRDAGAEGEMAFPTWKDFLDANGSQMVMQTVSEGI